MPGSATNDHMISETAEHLLVFAEQATGDDRVALEALVKWLHAEVQPPKGTVRQWAERPYIMQVALLTAGVVFDGGPIAQRYVRAGHGIERYKAENPDWQRRERVLDPDNPTKSVVARQHRRQQYLRAKRRARNENAA